MGCGQQVCIYRVTGRLDYERLTNDDRMMIACCNDGTRPVIFRIERIDIPENDEEQEWLAKQNFKNTAEMPILVKLQIGV